MTYRHDPYDPKQAALLDQASLEEAVAAAEKSFASAADLDALHALRRAHLGDRAPVSQARREIGVLPPAAKAEAGRRVNEARAAIQAAHDARLAELTAERESRVLAEEAVDVTLPWDRRPRGARHPLTTLMERIADLFVGMGYEVGEEPEVEAEWDNVDALTSTPDHPARGLTDTVVIARRGAGRPGDGPPGEVAETASSGLVLRSHTSPVAVRALLTRPLPIRVVIPGRAYRPDAPDATHTPVFHQVEGLVVDRGITMAHLRGTLEHVARAVFGSQVRIRWRPHYVPFTEPSAEVDVWFAEHPDGPRWVAWGGCGMVNPQVLRACGIDPQEYSGFAFGVGIERTLMVRNRVSDMHDLAEGDVRFTRALGTEG